MLTAKGTCFMYRDFGISTELIDKPVNIVQQKFLREVVQAIGKYEPRCRVRRIRWQGDVDGFLKPILEVEIDDD